MRTQRFSSLGQEAGHHWAEIMPRRYQFDRLPKSIEALNAVTSEHVKAFFQEYLAPDGPERRKLSLRASGTSAESASTKDRSDGRHLRSLRDIRDFHARSETFEPPATVVLPE